MKFKRFLSATTALLMAATLLASCASEPAVKDPADSTTENTPPAVEETSITLYVDANSESTGDGSETAPFKTILEAQEKIRELKAADDFSADGITVILKDGEYRLSKGLNFAAEDSGTADCPITYTSENEGGAIISGGVILSADDFEALSDDEKSKLVDETAKENVVKVDLSKYGIDPAVIETVGSNAMELFIDGNRSMLARYPNDSFVKTTDVLDNGDSHEIYSNPGFDSGGDHIPVPGFSYAENNRGGTFTVSDEVKDRVLKWSSYDGIYAQGYFKWGWSASTTLIGSFNMDESSITLSKAVTYGLSIGAPFYFLNVYEELDTAGEFFIDKTTGVLYVYKTEGFDAAEIMISELSEDLITTASVSNLSFKNLTLCATRGNGMNIYGNGILIDNCDIYNVRGGAVSVNGTNITVQNCELSNLGTYGVNVIGGDATTLTSSNNLVHNNYIHDFGIIVRTGQNAVKVSGCGTTVSHNEVANAPHQAMDWNGPNHVFEYNEVYNVCFETSDCGAFYAGRNFTSYGTVIRYNYIHDIGSKTSGAHAIYWDDGLSGQTAYGNLIVNTTSNAFMIGGGRDNVIENNIIINSTSKPINYDNRTRDAMLDSSAWFSHNIEMSNVIPSFQNEHWAKAFPIYSEIIPYNTEYTGDLDNPLLSANPGNCTIKNNISYYLRASGKEHTIWEYLRENGDVANNPLIKITLDETNAWTEGDRSLITDSRGTEQCPDFIALPFEEMGLVK